MNPNFPSPGPDDSLPPDDALEVQVTALLLGELTLPEAEALRARIAAEPALRTLHDRLRIAIELTREVSGSRRAKEIPRPEAPRLDAARRDQLLARFRTPATPDNVVPLPAPPARQRSNRREWLAMAAMLVVLLAAASGVSLFQRDRGERYAFDRSPTSAVNEGFFDSPPPAASESKDRTLLRRQSTPSAQPPTGTTDTFEQRRGVNQGLADDGSAKSEVASRYALLPALRQAEAPIDQLDSVARAKREQLLSRTRPYANRGEVEADSRRLNFGMEPILAERNGLSAPTTTPPRGGTALNALTDGLDDNGRVMEPQQDAEQLQRGDKPASAPPSNQATRFGGFAFKNELTPKAESERPEVQLGQAVEYARRDLSSIAESIAQEAKPATPAIQPLATFDRDPASARWEDQASVKERGTTRPTTTDYFMRPGNEERFGVNAATRKVPAAGGPGTGGQGFGGGVAPMAGGTKNYFFSPPPADGRHWSVQRSEPNAQRDDVKRELASKADAASATRLESRLGKVVSGDLLGEERKLAEIKQVQSDGLAVANGVVNGPILAFSKQLADPAATQPATTDETVAGLKVQESVEKTMELTAADKLVTELALVRLQASDAKVAQTDAPVELPPPAPSIPQPEVTTAENPFSTFSLNVSDVSFKLTAAALEKGALPAPGTIRTEEFINAFDYRDPEPAGVAPVAFTWERARDAFAHNRDLLRFSIKTAATGRQPGKPLNVVLLVDNSGSMERADRVRIRHECLRILAGQLQAGDRISVVAFARTARLWMDGVAGNQASDLADRIGSLTPEGGTNLEDALDLAYKTARRHFNPAGVNRVVMLTDGAANLGDVSPDSLRRRVEDNRRQGVALDCFGIGWEGLNDDLLENLSRNGDGRYGFINTPEAAATGFAAQLAGALQVAASDVKVQVEFNPLRVTTHRQVGYARHQLKKEQFRDNTVDAAELAAAEAGNALYTAQVNAAGSGPIATVRVRFRIPGTADYREHEWTVPYEGSARALDQSSANLRLAAVASNFAEWLAQSPYAAEVSPDALLPLLNGVPQAWPADPRPAQLESMIRQARALTGK